MKNSPLLAVFVLLLIQGCDKSDEESPIKFPDCVGIEGSFNPDRIQKAYQGRLWNQDTSISTQFIFTEYGYDLSIFRTSWLMWFKLDTSPTSVRYQSAHCFGSNITDTWYASTGFDFGGLYSTWDFYFEEFDCSDLSGYCAVIQADIQDTLEFSFEGSR